MRYTYILNFDDIYFYQPNLVLRGKIVDLRIFGEVKYMCSYNQLSILEERLKEIDYYDIKFFGKSDYHYLTFLFIKKIKIPFILVVFDSHEDAKPTFEGYISCGSWLLEARKLKFLRDIVLIRNSQEFERINMVSKRNPLYITIDKDIISKKYLNTTWDQGDMDPEELIGILEYLNRFNIIGVDVCGEPGFNLSEQRKSEQINLTIWEIFSNNSIRNKNKTA